MSRYLGELLHAVTQNREIRPRYRECGLAVTSYLKCAGAFERGAHALLRRLRQQQGLLIHRVGEGLADLIQFCTDRGCLIELYSAKPDLVSDKRNARDLLCQRLGDGLVGRE